MGSSDSLSWFENFGFLKINTDDTFNQEKQWSSCATFVKDHLRNVLTTTVRSIRARTCLELKVAAVVVAHTLRINLNMQDVIIESNNQNLIHVSQGRAAIV